MSSFLQSTDWLEFQKSIGRKAWSYGGDSIQANIIEHDLPYTNKTYLYAPHGPFLVSEEFPTELKTSFSSFLDYTKKLTRESNSIFIKIEPQDDLIAELLAPMGFKKSTREIQPHKSVIINLEPPEDQLLGQMHHKTRYNIRLAEKRGVYVKEEGDVEKFWRLLTRTAKVDRFATHKKYYYQRLFNFFQSGQSISSKMFFAYLKDRPIAGMMNFHYSDTVYYVHGAMDRGYKSLMAPYLMHWEAMMKSKAEGFQYYDFWGIDAQRWPGVTRFKLGFGGQTVEYPGSFDLPISKFWYGLYNIFRKIL